jgi:aldehyde dehydrogenase (NAD(P)+)
VTLDAPSVAEFLDQAVRFVNNTVWGTLSATVVVSQQSLSDARVDAAVERAVANLRYGTVALIGPGTLGFYTMLGPWGGYPGSTLEDIQSGTCRVTNALMLHRPQKTVVRAPFNWWPYPFLGTAKNLHVFSRRLAAFDADTTLSRLPGLFWSAVRT